MKTPYVAVDQGHLIVAREGSTGTEVAAYRRDDEGTWTADGALPRPSGAGEWLGIGLSVSGDFALVGDAPPRTARPGAAYLYSRAAGIWTIVQSLEPVEPDETGGFGLAVALGGRSAVVGAPGGAQNPASLTGRVSAHRLLEPRAYLPVLPTIRRRF